MEPIQLYRFIAPKDAMPTIIKTLSRGKIGSPGQAKLALPFMALRAALNLQRIPDVGDVNIGPILPVSTEHLQIALLGHKEDEVGIIEPTGVKQEKI